jgi:tetratricopeptide (TPR) repeat protein
MRSFVANADTDLILPVRNVERIIRLETNFAMNAGPTLNRLKRFPGEYACTWLPWICFYLGRFDEAIAFGQIEDTQHACEQIFEFHELVGVELAEAVTKTTAGVAQIAAGQMDAGLNLLKAGRQALLEGEAMTAYCLCEYIMGKVYLQMTAKTEPLSFLTLVRNIGFIVKNVPFAAQKAEKHFEKAIELSQKIGAKSISGPAYLDMGLLYHCQKKDERARESITKAVKIFKECEAEVYLKQARKELKSLS